MKTQSFFDLTVSAPVRLARLRRAFAEESAKYPHMNYKTWRDIRGTNFTSVGAYCGELSQGFNGKTQIWYSHTGPQFRGEKDASDVVEYYGRGRFPGYYTDVDRNETACGIVARLTRGRFIAGYRWTSNGERVYYPDIYDNIDDAACAADGHAERFADLAREDDAKFNAARDIESSIEDALHRLRECLAMRHLECLAYVRDEIRELCETIREKRETLSTEYADYV